MSKKQLLLIIGSLIILAFIVGYLVISFVPNVAAQGANALRGVIGKEAVGELESIYFTLQDNIKQVQYDTGIAEAEAPWELPTVMPTLEPIAIVVHVTDTPIATSEPELANPAIIDSTVVAPTAVLPTSHFTIHNQKRPFPFPFSSAIIPLPRAYKQTREQLY